MTSYQGKRNVVYCNIWSRRKILRSIDIWSRITLSRSIVGEELVRIAETSEVGGK